MSTPVYSPQISVSLYKTRQRTTLGAGAPTGVRFTTTAKRIDLTPYLAQGSSVTTRKGVRDPAGAFTIMVPDKPYAGTKQPDGTGTAETLYGLIEPMDVIEIRMRHGAGAGALPLIMRGFVSNIARRQQMGPDGPVRSVMISGQDYGKLWQQLQIRYLQGYIIGQDIITAFKFFEKFKDGFKTVMTGPEFIRTMINSIFNPYLENLMPESSTMPRQIFIDEKQLAIHGTAAVIGLQSREGTVYSLMSAFADVGPWNELFLEDREDGVYCVYRPNPFKRLDGSPIVADSVQPETIEVPGTDLVAIDVSRTDANVANYFWVRAPRFDLVQDMVMRQDQVLQAKSETVILSGYENTTETLYGVKLMELSSEMGGDNVTTFNSGLPEAENVAREALMANWLNYRRGILSDSNRDNVVLESGSATLRGNETLRPGRYMRLLQGKLASEFYVTSVAHNFAPFQSFTTTVSLERGTGFVQRATRGGGADSPYFAEMQK